MNKISNYLNQNILGNAFSNTDILEKFSTDKSILQIQPQVVAYPEDTNDVRKLVKFSSKLSEKGIKLNVTMRGGGNDKTGAAIGDGMIVVTEKMNGILEIDQRQKLVRLQPGVTVKGLNDTLKHFGMMVPVDPIYDGHTIGGLIANNLSDRYDGKYGGISGYVAQAEVVLSNGDVIQTGRLSKRELNKKKGLQTLEGDIYRRLDNLIEDRKDTIMEFLGADDIDNAGYEMISRVKLADGSFDLLPIFFASQGTLGVVTELIMKTEFVSDAPSMMLAEFTSYDAARDAIDYILQFQPLFIDLYETSLIKDAERVGKKLKILDDSKDFASKVVLVFGFDDMNVKARQKSMKKIAKFLSGDESRYVFSDDEMLDDFGAIKSMLVGYLNDDSRGMRLPLVDNSSVHINYLGEYLGAVHALESRLKVRLPVYGSVTSGVYNVRPEFVLANLSDRQQIFKFLKEYSAIISGLDGSITGGAPEGRVKAIFAYTKLNEQLIDVYKHIKEIFDPSGILNPGVKCECALKDVVSKMRRDYDGELMRD